LADWRLREIVLAEMIFVNNVRARRWLKEAAYPPQHNAIRRISIPEIDCSASRPAGGKNGTQCVSVL
jgi:hypothetical protein